MILAGISFELTWPEDHVWYSFEHPISQNKYFSKCVPVCSNEPIDTLRRVFNFQVLNRIHKFRRYDWFW